MTARNHHYVPRCYLKGFAENPRKPKLFVVDAKEKRTFTTATTNIAAERDFHRINVDGLPIDALENAFSKFESELSLALERIITVRSIADENDRSFLFNLIGLMATKNPSFREVVRRGIEQTSKIVMSMVTATPERWESQVKQAKAAGYLKENDVADYEGMKQFIAKGEYTVQVETTGQLQRELKLFNEILPLIFQRKWMLLKAPSGSTGFITSDHPMCLMWSDPKLRGGFYSPGLGLRNTQIVFPISNELVAIGAFEIKDAEVDADELLIAQVNGSIALHSMRQVYARDSNFTYIMGHNSKIMPGVDLLNEIRKHTAETAE